MKDFTFRWYDPVYNKWAEFKASNEEDFCENAINAAIDYRMASVLSTGSSTCYYPFGCLEIRHGGLDERWQGMRLAWNCPPMQLQALGSLRVVVGNHESDATRIRSLAHVWWESIQRWTDSYTHHLTADSGTHSLPAKVAPG